MLRIKNHCILRIKDKEYKIKTILEFLSYESAGRLTTLGCARQMLQQEGAAAFARGIGPPLANAMLLNTVMFVCFAEARRHLPQTTVGSLLAGGLSGVAQAFLTTPLDWLKIQVRV